ncbi:hypothetical protein F5Y15DRAFT_219459 [Xylariaceae sp. FL0016]|nr:hypothetical protein F5Y15DRAFT_219459 [Xylariaceae sp. FL0016]
MSDAVLSITHENEGHGKVIITLSSRTPGPIAERRIVLTRAVPSIRVGRASKVSSKGFVAAIDNAWFESPVMSREHAMITADFDSDPTTISIKDTKSLHGTYVTAKNDHHSERKVDPERPENLTDGDTVRFGIDISRSKETFPPCTVDFHLEVDADRDSHLANRVFTVPDGVDDEEEEEEDDDASESDSIIETEAPAYDDDKSSSLDGDASPIDLTAEDTELPNNLDLASSIAVQNHNGSDFIDLTDEPEQVSEVDTDRSSDAIASGVNQCPAVEPMIEDAPDQYAATETMGFSIPYQQVDDSSMSKNQFVGSVGLFTVPLDGSESEGSESPLLTSSDDESMLSGDESISDEGSNMDLDENMFETSSSAFEDEYGASDDFEEDEEESKSPWSTFPSPEEEDVDRSLGLHNSPYYDDSMSSCSHGANGDVVASPVAPPPSSSARSVPEKHNAATYVAQAYFEGPGVVRAECQVAPGYPFGLFNPFQEHMPDFASITPAPREPSPSDAAMFKSRPLSQDASELRAKSLGEKTGKALYFAAREENRMILNNPVGPIPVSAMRETLNEGHDMDTSAVLAVSNALKASAPAGAAQQGCAEPAVHCDESTGFQESFDGTESAPIELEDSSNSHDSAWSMSGEKFINHPAATDIPSLQEAWKHTPDFDMTSAYAYQQSKSSAEHIQSRNIRRLQIQDLLAQDPSDRAQAMDELCPARSPGPLHAAELGSNSTKRTPYADCNSMVKESNQRLKSDTATKRSFETAFKDPEDVAMAEAHIVRTDGQRTPTKSDYQGSEPSNEVPSEQRVNTVPENTLGDLITESQNEQRWLSAKPVAIATSTPRNDERPSKRQRLTQGLMCVGSVVVGGVAAFSYLVSSAPAFT